MAGAKKPAAPSVRNSAASMVLGIAELGDVRRLGRVGLRTLVFTLILSACSVGIGVTLANVVRPGSHLSADRRAALRERYASQAAEQVAQARLAKPLRETLLDIIPKNPLQEMVGALDGSSPGGGMLAVMFFALLFGIALTLAPPERTQPLIRVLEGVYDTVMVIVGLAMRLAMARCLLGPNDGFLVMDDPLADLDPRRQAAAAGLLCEYARDRQVVVFTCHPGHAELLGGASAMLGDVEAGAARREVV